MPAKDPLERSLLASKAVNARWARAGVGEAARQAGRAWEKRRAAWALEIDPAGTMPRDELTKRLRSKSAQWSAEMRLAKLRKKRASP
jgi:hypothetical protein